MKLTAPPKSVLDSSLRLLRQSLIFTVATAVAVLAQNTVRVPADSPTIQGAISVANSGDTVLVSPGTYVESINFLGKAITVTSTDGAASTIIDGGGSQTVVWIDAASGPQALSGFTVRNGYSATGSAGGIEINGSSPSITNNILTNDVGQAAIVVSGGSPLVQGNSITGSAQYFGVGIAVSGGSSRILTNVITGNSSFSDGGGIWIGDSASALIQNNYIANNSGVGGGGIAVTSNAANTIISQNIIVNNTSSSDGGAGILLSNGVQVQLLNNTLSGNSSSDGNSGIYVNSVSGTTMANNVVAVSSGSAISCSINVPANIISHNNAYSSAGQSWGGNCASALGTSGNFALDPQFTDPVNGNYHLATGSPAIDAGDITIPSLPALDYSGAARLGDDSGQCVFVIDLGVYQSHSAAPGSLSVTPASLLFPDTPVGSTSAAQPITLNSTGQGCFRLTGFNVTGDFSQTNACGSGVPAGQSCTVQASFVPTAVGLRNGTFSVLMNTNAGTAPAPVSLSGNGLQALPALSYAPASLSFASQNVGTASTAQTITLSNTGGGPYSLSQFVISAPDFTQTNNCPASIAPHTSCTINVTFAPTSSGPLSATLSASGSPAGAGGSVSLSGTGLAAAASVAPNSITFATQRVGTTSPAQVITVSNTGNAALSIWSIDASGPAAFVQTNDCPASLAAGSSCSINVTFSPTLTGGYNTYVNIHDNSGGSPGSYTTQTVAVAGTGGSSIASATPANLSFAGTTVGSSSAPSPVTLRNTGTMPLNISSISISGDFSQSNNCGSSVAAGASCTLNVTFTPTASGSRTGTLTINDDSANGSPQTVSLSGTGNAPTASLSPASLSFALQRLGSTSAAQAVTLSNTGTSPLNISSIATNGAFGQTNNCPGSLAVGNSCSISVTFHPTQTGTASGSVVVTDDSGAIAGSAQSVSLTGTGGSSIANVSPSSLTFATTKVGTSSAGSTVTISNSGTMSLNFNSIAVAGDFSQSNSCGSAVAAGGSCQVTVVFTPTATGTRSGTLTINDDSQTGGIQIVSLSGTGALPSATVTPASLSFATTATGTQSASSPVTLHNTGVVIMNVTSIATSGDFVQTNNCSATLAAGASCSINVSFAPTTSGTRTGTLTVTDDATGGSQTVSLTGSATDYKLTISPASVSVNAGQTATYNATVAAVGGTYNQSVTLACSGLPSGASCTLNPTSVIPGSTSKNSQVRIVTQRNVTPSGTYTIIVSGTVNNITRSVTATLIVK